MTLAFRRTRARVAGLTVRPKSPEKRLLAAVQDVRADLRSGAALRAALEREAMRPDSPFAFVVPLFDEPLPLAAVLLDAAHHPQANGAGRVLAALAVDSKTGGDAGRTLDGIEAELRRQQRVRRESRSLAAQARLSARLVLLGLTPLTVLLLLVFSPFGAAKQYAQPIGAVALVVGVLVQLAGVLFIELIAAAPARQLNVPPPPRLPNWPGAGAAGSRLPVTKGTRLERMAKALAPQTYGKTVKTTTLIAVADVMAGAIESGATPLQGLEAAAPLVPAELGGALRRAVLEARAGMPLVAALRETTAALDDDDVDALVALIERSERLGVPLADALRRLAADLHEVQETSANEDARRASVWSMLPLTVVVIPGYLLTTLVPVLFAVLTRIADLAHGLQG